MAAKSATQGKGEALSALLIVDAPRPGHYLGSDMLKGRLEAVAQVLIMTVLQGATPIADIEQAFAMEEPESKAPDATVLVNNFVIHSKDYGPKIKSDLHGKRASALSVNA